MASLLSRDVKTVQTIPVRDVEYKIIQVNRTLCAIYSDGAFGIFRRSDGGNLKLTNMVIELSTLGIGLVSCTD